MNAYRATSSAAYFTAGAAAFGSTSTSISITLGGNSVLQRGYDALSHLWTLMKAGWVSPTNSKSQPSSAELIEFAYSERLKTVSAYPSLASVLTMEMAAKAAYLVMAGQKLSNPSVARLSRLARSLDNWDGEGSKAMSLSSLINFVSFLEKNREVPSDIHIFLGFYGEIVTSWGLKDGSTLDMSFGDHQIELATDEHDEVFAIGDNGLYRLIAEL
ncbi:hypothetical protein NL64_13230 [Pseudomonas fluorescens]|uniref:hypothetical protein n=1 Tax=Pseudomonas fluorescens TaxID=294 RepID=UPI00054BF4A9|nr:hypothetical protein [Pseudomonas fluorescens]KII32202.1 hypothetical protein NL64_13230 [Pseudomonas fluorescens]